MRAELAEWQWAGMTGVVSQQASLGRGGQWGPQDDTVDGCRDGGAVGQGHGPGPVDVDGLGGEDVVGHENVEHGVACSNEKSTWGKGRHILGKGMGGEGNSIQQLEEA